MNLYVHTLLYFRLITISTVALSSRRATFRCIFIRATTIYRLRFSSVHLKFIQRETQSKCRSTLAWYHQHTPLIKSANHQRTQRPRTMYIHPYIYLKISIKNRVSRRKSTAVKSVLLILIQKKANRLLKPRPVLQFCPHIVFRVKKPFKLQELISCYAAMSATSTTMFSYYSWLLKTSISPLTLKKSTQFSSKEEFRLAAPISPQ